MKNIEINLKKENYSNPIDKNQKRIKNHRIAATHLLTAAKYHLAAATHHEEGNHQKGEESMIAAHGQIALSNKAQKAGVRQHAING